MALADYTTLTAAKSTAGSIKQFANNDNLPITTILSEAQSWIYRNLRTPEMLTNSVGTITTSAISLAVPTRFLAPVYFFITGTDRGKIEIKSLSDVRDQWSYDGSGVRVKAKPSMASCDLASFWFDVMADKAYVVRLEYYQSLAELSTATGGTTNFLTDRFPNLLRAACMMQAAFWQKDEKNRLAWEANAVAQIQSARLEADEIAASELQQMEVE